MVSLNLTSGHDQQGTRPFLFAYPFASNQLTKAPVVRPITEVGGNNHNGCRTEPFVDRA